MKLLDLFSGIGGFHKGFEQAGFTFDWVGFSEIDKYASSVYKYKFPKSEELGDVTTIRPENLPKDIDILCGGFPCQTFSIAGKRAGFNDTRGTLFFEIARILRYFRDIEKPIPYFILENVKGLLNHDNGRTFNTIYGVLTDLDYTVECQLLNTRWFLPQNRERIYLVGHLGEGRGHKVFPIGEDGREFNKSSGEENKKSTSMQNGYSRTISSRIHKMGCEDTYIIDKKGNKKNNQHYAANLSGGGHSGGNHSDMDLIKLNQIGNLNRHNYEMGGRVYSSNGIAKTLGGDGGNNDDKTGLYKVQPVLTPNRAEKRQNGRRFKEDGEPAFTLNTQDQHGVMIERSQIRRLTPVECCRLQGFPDDWNEYGEFDGKVVPMSDTQRYKQCGNAVSVPVVQAVGDTLLKNLI